MPRTVTALKKPTFIAQRPQVAVPRLSVRQRSTPCHSGVAYASARSARGSWVTGKKVPENRYNGITTHLKRLPTTFGLDTVAANAAVGVAKASPVSVAAGTASRTSHDLTAPKAAIPAPK